MAEQPEQPVQLQPNCFYTPDKEFPVFCDIDYAKAYCCKSEANIFDDPTKTFVFCDGENCKIGPPQCHMVFPEFNDDDQPMHKTAISGTTKSAWVKIAFQQYEEAAENPDATWETILTMGNISQPFNDEKCMATIKAFQYGWGTVNQGNRCKITIQDQKGSSFQEWVERMAINPEGDAVPVQGKYRMKLQFGWYTTGGADEDVCGQPPMPLSKEQTDAGELKITEAAEGFNSAFIICSPVMYFITDWINVHFEQGKFTYELEATDTLIRGQENMVNQIFGGPEKIFFTKAVELLGKFSFPPFRPEFKARDATGAVVDMQFVVNNFEDRACRVPIDCDSGGGNPDWEDDCEGWGVFQVWRTNQMSPLSIIQEWLKQGVFARDLTGKVTSNQAKVGITMNFDPTYKFDPQKKGTDPCSTCNSDQPQYGRLILWANAIPYCQGNFSDDEINNRMKAVYVVNGGNCSPVLQFSPVFRWHSMAAQKAGGMAVPIGGNNTNVQQVAGIVKANCPIAASRGPLRNIRPVPTERVMKTRTPALDTQEASYHQIMSNLAIGAIEADLRVQGDPSNWLCTPAEGYGGCVGIVFINPYFLIQGDSDTDCPTWQGGDPNNPNEGFRSICNQLLTSKGWFIMGVDHQIKDGSYITTLKLMLIAPGAELNQNTEGSSPTRLGGWEEANPLPYGGQFGCLRKYLVGSAGAAWNQQELNTWVGGGTSCESGYLISPELPPDDDE